MLSGSPSHFMLHAPTRNFDIDVDVDGACITVGDHNYFQYITPIPLPVVGGWWCVGWMVGRPIDGGRRKT